jgi:para-aminobenzoate synthetase component 1
MIVDLVRNDLARICLSGTVKVDELCGAYTYRSVNHLVSSVSGELKPEVGLTDIFQAMFPMGSMTGAPKLEVMKHIELYETGSRGIYSGCIGYISPDGDFDFNVVIRTLVYEPDSGKVSYRVGSAITYDSIPEKEYEECMLKGSRLASVFRDSVL